MTLDVLPQKFHLIKREHGQNAANDGQTFDVGLFFIGPLVEVSGDGAKAVQDVAMQGGNGCWGLVVGIMQVRLSRAGNVQIKFNCTRCPLILLDLRSIRIQLFPVVKDVGQTLVILGR